MANEEHLAILKQGVEVWNKWRYENPNTIPNLKKADLSEENLKYVNFRWTDLTDANLHSTNLTGAEIFEANFGRASLVGAKLRSVELISTSFGGTELKGVDLTNAHMGFNSFARVDLSSARGLETVTHIGPSSISIDTMYLSGGHIPEVFLRGAGVPSNFITYMKSLASQPIDFYSCFISHSSKDKEFVERLYADLQSNGVRCWYAPEDLQIGEPFLLGIDHGIRLHDKLLLVLSEHSVNSGWVQHEVLSALAKEQGKEPWVLFPIRLDDAVMETTIPWATMIRQSRHIGDFTHWKEHDSYKKAFDKLLQDLKGKA